MELIKKIIFDLNNNIYTRIDAKQNDIKSRYIEFTLTNSGVAVDLTGHTVKIFAVKVDNTIIFNNVQITDAANGKVLVELTSQSLAVVGELQCELVIYDGDNSVLSSKVFTINVLKSIRNDSAVESTNEFTALTQGIAKLNGWDQQFQSKYDGLNAEYAQQLTANTNKIGNLSTNGITESSVAEAIKNDRSKLSEITYLVSSFKQVGDSDDTDSINRALAFVNSLGGGKVRIPYRSTQYVISKTLLIYSNTTLEVDEFATIFLSNNSNCRMLENANKSTQSNLTRLNSNIKIVGGIWNGNGDNQTKMIADGGSCTGFLFSGVDRLIFKPTKIINTQTYGCWFCNVNNLFIENMEIFIPKPTSIHNQDGIHIQGPSSNITIRDCILKADDNIIALNADDVAQGTYSTTGDITDVYIDNIVFNSTGQGILLLSGTSLVDRVTIKNITGKAYYLVNLCTWGFGNGNYGDITIENVNIDWDEQRDKLAYRDKYIYIEGLIDSLKLKNIKIPKGTGDGYNNCIYISKDFCPNTVIQKLIIEGFEDNTVTDFPHIPTFVYVNNSTILNCELNNFKSIYNTDSGGVYPIQIVNSNITNLNMKNFNIVNAKLGVLLIGESNLTNIYYDRIIVDSATSRNTIYKVGSQTSNLFKITNSGDVDVPAIFTSNVLDKDYIHKNSSLPTSGYWRVGDIIYNSNPVATGYLGWVCTSAGYLYKANWTANTAYSKGDVINANNGLFLCKVAGTSGTVMPSKWSGDSTDGTVTWTFLYPFTSSAVFKTFGLISS